MAAVLAPTCLWAERSDKLYLTIEVSDASAVVAKIGDTHISFSCTGADGKRYALELELAGEVEEEGSKVALTPRCVALVVPKKADGPFWGRLLSAKAPHNVKVDWSKYVDEDEEEAESKGAPRGVLGRGWAAVASASPSPAQAPLAHAPPPAQPRTRTRAGGSTSARWTR